MMVMGVVPICPFVPFSISFSSLMTHVELFSGATHDRLCLLCLLVVSRTRLITGCISGMLPVALALLPPLSG